MNQSGEGMMNLALVFILQKGKWLENYCARILWRLGYPTYWAQDVAQHVRFNFSKVEDVIWESISSKDWYVRRATWREVRRFCAQNKPQEEAVDYEFLTSLPGETSGGDPQEFLESQERILWYREQLTKELRELFDYYLWNERGGGFKEIAAELGISYGAARKRAERLRKEMLVLMREKDASPSTRDDDAPDAASDETSLVILADS